MKRAFMERRFQTSVRAIIADANKIIEKYAAQGLTLTVRQLYYRFIAFDLFPASWIDTAYNKRNGLDPNTKNTLKNYKRLAGIVNDGRVAGWIDWDAIEDRTRWLRDYATYDDAAQLIREANYRYAEAIWELSQPCYVEVWVEKDALVGVIEGPCNELRVPYFPTRGYLSQSEAYSTGQRLRDKLDSGKEVVIFHLGDHDPSGLDMSRDLEERMKTFACTEDINFQRIALNMDQVTKYNPPPNPAKETDSRFAQYNSEYGDESWELDALEPEIIQALVKDSVKTLIDQSAWDAAIADETHNRQVLSELTNRWPLIKTFLERRIPSQSE